MTAPATDLHAQGWRTRASPEALAARARFPRDRLLSRIGADLRALFPGRVERVVLYGSRARDLISGGHEARDDGDVEDSDWDVAVFVDGWSSDAHRWPLFDWAQALSEETGWDIQAFGFGAGGWKVRTIFMFGLRRDAVDL